MCARPGDLLKSSAEQRAALTEAGREIVRLSFGRATALINKLRATVLRAGPRPNGMTRSDGELIAAADHALKSHLPSRPVQRLPRLRCARATQRVRR
jgi:hypothetical protein